jgi:ADP-ribose pyrophosphatase
MTGYPVRASHERFAGPVFRLVTDEVRMPDGQYVNRDYLVHIGAVGVVALDLDGKVVLVRQYRHPLRRQLWELPAGLADVAGEDVQATAARELAEEADLIAARWDRLIDVHTSPGCSNEMIRIFLARDLTPVPEAQLHVRTHEEAQMTTSWFDLDEAVRMVFAGEITNAAAVTGLLAAARVRDQDWLVLPGLCSPPPNPGSGCPQEGLPSA